MMKRTFWVLFILLLAFSCKQKQNRLRNGDLVFVGLPAEYNADAAVERAKSFCGRNYDLRFLSDNEDLYCSELVQKSYLDTAGRPIFKSEPMNFKAPDGTIPPYWEGLFGRLGMDVPQGLPGTNPQKMSQASCLEEIPVFF